MKFLVTEESGRLARWLRLMGYDAAWAVGQSLSAIYRRAYQEGRVVVTRNRKVGASSLFRVAQLQSERLDEQLRQLLREGLVVVDDRQLFTCCDLCNVSLDRVEKSDVQSRVPPYVFQTQEQFHRCPVCEMVYWAATHYARAKAFMEQLA